MPCPAAIASYPTYTVYEMSQPYNYLPLSSPVFFLAANEKATTPISDSTGAENLKSHNAKEADGPMQKCPFRKSVGRNYPSRLRRPMRSLSTDKKLGWRPRMLVEPRGENSVDGGAVDSPRPRVSLPMAPLSGQGSNTTVMIKKPLNPNAQEWAPKQIAPPPTPQRAIPVLPCPAAIASYPTYTVYEMSQPYNYLPLSSPVFFLAANEKATTPISDSTGAENLKSHNAKEMDGPMQKCPFRKSVGRNYPPRLRRPTRSLSTDKELGWRPRKLVEPRDENSVEGGAVDSPRSHVSLPMAPLSGQGSNTTVMIKNIPNRLRRDDILKFLDGHCCAYSLEYDFLYLPMDFRKKGNLGYAFVNFTTAIAANKFKKILQNFKWETVKTDSGSFISKKICEITWARLQGKEVYTRRFKHAEFACDEFEFLPVLLDPPRNGSDPNPCPPLVLGSIQLQRRSSSKNY